MIVLQEPVKRSGGETQVVSAVGGGPPLVAMMPALIAPAANGSGPFYTGIKTEHIQSISDFVAAFMLPRQPHWPIGGANSAKHSACFLHTLAVN